MFHLSSNLATKHFVLQPEIEPVGCQRRGTVKEHYTRALTARLRMASFRFNFDEQPSGEEETFAVSKRPVCSPVREAKELVVEETSTTPPLHEVEQTTLCEGQIVLRHVKASCVEKKLEKSSYVSDIASASKLNTDLIPCEYEGGVKLWECAVDLVEYLHGTVDVELRGASVLELGCGTALPGIFALLQGAIVHFQDYNEEVLEHVTIPNILLNENKAKLTGILQQCRFFAGDWGDLLGIINARSAQEQKYDVILTSETIYNADSHEKLFKLMKGLLKKPHGVAYIAAKTYYFGVGGGTRMFEDLVKNDGTFNITACITHHGGLQREILCMVHKTMEDDI